MGRLRGSQEALEDFRVSQGVYRGHMELQRCIEGFIRSHVVTESFRDPGGVPEDFQKCFKRPRKIIGSLWGLKLFQGSFWGLEMFSGNFREFQRVTRSISGNLFCFQRVSEDLVSVSGVSEALQGACEAPLRGLRCVVVSLSSRVIHEF